MFSPDQVTRYLAHISFPDDAKSAGRLSYLKELQKRHLARVPFESLSLHYSKYHLLSLNQQDLFQKIVTRGMGGYCMENNTFFGAMLRSLGFTVFNAGGRVSDATAGRPGPGYTGLYVA
jgi:arylamine N-acetyltransferase